MPENYSCDNSGNRVPPHPNMGDPVLGSAKNIICPIQNADHSVTGLTAGAMYAITCLVGPHIFGVVSIDTDDANGIWACGEGETIIIRMPIGYTTLICQTPDTTAFHRCILRRLKDVVGA